MDIPNSFVPNSNLDDMVESYLNKVPLDNQGLAIALGMDVGTHHKGYIYVCDPSVKGVTFVRKRDALILDICYWNNKLYDCGVYKKIYDTLTDKEIVTSTLSILSMKGFKKNLVYSHFHKVRLEMYKERQREGWVYALEMYEDELYDAGEYPVIYSTLDNEIVARREQKVRALCSHRGELYDAGDSGIVHNTLTGERIAERFSQTIYTLCSFKGRLIDGGSYGAVIDTVTDMPLLDFGDYTVTALETIPMELVKELMKIGNPKKLQV